VSLYRSRSGYDRTRRTRRSHGFAAVPDQPQRVPEGTGPPDWHDLRTDFTLAMRQSLSARTIDTYLTQCDAYARWLAETVPGRPVQASTRSDLRGYLVALQERGLADNSRATAHRSLRALFKFMLGDEIIENNPMAAIPAPSIAEERVPPALTPEQVDAMVKACAPKSTFTGARDRALILLISSSGLRSSEALGLTEQDLHLDSDAPSVVVRGKGDRYREAAVSFEAALAIRAYQRARRKHASAWRSELWLGRTGDPFTGSGLRQVVKDAARRAGVGNVHVHALRHSATHAMLNRGMGEHDVATQLGHKSLKMLGRYGRARAAERSRASFFRTSR
jgi:site-specific recombinase XerD